MALLVQPNTRPNALPLGLRIPRPSPRLTMAGLGAIFAVLLADALFNARAFFDLPLLKTIQRVDLPLLDEVLSPIDWAASSEGGIAIWAALMAAFLLARWWRWRCWRSRSAVSSMRRSAWSPTTSARALKRSRA
jgi:hypothetical protein